MSPPWFEICPLDFVRSAQFGLWPSDLWRNPKQYICCAICKKENFKYPLGGNNTPREHKVRYISTYMR